MTSNQLAENSVIQLLNSVKLARDNAERADNRVDHSFYYALTIALEELQERRKADTDPYGFTDGDRRGMIYKPEHAYRLSDPVQVYRHAQPAPVVSADLLHSAASAIEDLLTTKDRTGAGVWFDLPFKLRSAANAQPAPVVPEEKPIPNTLSMYAVDAVAAIAEVKGWNACRAAMLNGGKS